MTIEQAKSIIGNRSAWELRNMIKALSLFRILNTNEENQRLRAAKLVLKSLEKQSK